MTKRLFWKFVQKHFYYHLALKYIVIISEFNWNLLIETVILLLEKNIYLSYRLN